VSDKPSSQAIREFLGETEEILEKLNLDLVLLGDGIESGESDPELLNSIFRGAHSLKGLAGMFGFTDISDLAHHMENLLDRLRLGKVILDGILVEVLFEAIDLLTRLVQGKGETEDFTLDTAPLLDRIEAILGGRSAGTATPGEGKIPQEILSVLTEYEEHRLQENLRKGRNLLRVQATFSLTTFDQELAELTEALKQQGEVISTLPCVGDISERIAFQILLGSASDVAAITAALNRDDLRIELLSAGQASAAAPAKGPAPNVEPAAEPLREELAGGVEGARDGGDGGASLRSISRTVRVDIDKLDQLMNIVGELVLSKGAIADLGQRLRSVADSELVGSLQKATRMLERRLDELQKGVMEVRMVPIVQLFEKMTRIVRRVAGEQGKKVTLDLRGADTELDKLIIEDLSDPLMHIIRNAIDHGIELPEERLASGKSEKATICLWASQKGNHVVIEVSDDGRGIDPEMVRRKAVEKGLVATSAELSREDVYDLILTPGFSTRDEVSELSGRGVGLDVVRNNIAALSGMLELDSDLGQGTSIAITLPITLAIIKALIIESCGRTYAIPINSVLETLMLEPGAIRSIEKREMIELRQSTLPLLRLDDVFRLPQATRNGGRFFTVVVGLAEKRMGIVADQLLGQQDVVIKSLGNTLSFVRGIAGAADLGNQQTILVLDVGGLMGEALRGEVIGLYS
jgi:two-component system, chemotaxis family, sensor kinase CheA